jgi:23S rRNA pseudouridine2605 synthase
MSKLGYCSRSEATALIQAGKVTVNDRVQRGPEHPTVIGKDVICVQGQLVETERRAYVLLNKPRGLVTTTHDEHGRPTVMTCLQDSRLPRVSPVGRLDQASEGLLLLTNDTTWAAAITDPTRGTLKTYHVQVEGIPDASIITALRKGVKDQGETLYLKSVSVLRSAEKTAWLYITLTEGKNRHIRRMLAALNCPVMRLVRVSIGPIELGELGKGEWRELSTAEVDLLKPKPVAAKKSTKKSFFGRRPRPSSSAR